jgi:hypothetical protein
MMHHRFMTTKIHALKFVSILTIQGTDRIWIHMKPGENKDIPGIVAGVSPKDAPNMPHGSIGGEDHVPLGECLPGDLPKVFFGLFKIEAMTR